MLSIPRHHISLWTVAGTDGCAVCDDDPADPRRFPLPFDGPYALDGQSLPATETSAGQQGRMVVSTNDAITDAGDPGTTSLLDLGVKAGQLELAFDVIRTDGGVSPAPGGVQTVRFVIPPTLTLSPRPSMGVVGAGPATTSVSACPIALKTIGFHVRALVQPWTPHQDVERGGRQAGATRNAT